MAPDAATACCGRAPAGGVVDVVGGAAPVARSEAVVREADERFRASSVNLMKALSASKPEVDRAMAMMKQIDATSGAAVGQLWAGKIGAEILAIARDELFEASRIMDAFRRLQDSRSRL